MVKELRAAKSALQSQLSQMVAAEIELTQHLKETHQQIQEQLAALQTQLQVRPAPSHTHARAHTHTHTHTHIDTYTHVRRERSLD